MGGQKARATEEKAALAALEEPPGDEVSGPSSAGAVASQGLEVRPELVGRESKGEKPALRIEGSAERVKPLQRSAKGALEEEKHQLRLAVEGGLDEGEASPKKAAPKAVQQTRQRGFTLQVASSFSLTSMVSLAKYLETDVIMEEDVTGARGRSSALPVLEVVLVRSLVVIAFALSILAHDGKSPLGSPPCHPVLLLRGVLGACGVIAMLYAVVLLLLTEVIVFGLTQPLWGAFFGRVFLKEPLPKAVLFALPLCASGVLLIAKPWASVATDAFPHRGVGVAISLMQGACGAGAKTCVRYLGKGGYHPQVIVMYLTFCGSIASAAVLFGFQGGPVAPAQWQWLVMVVIGCCAFAGQTTGTMALRSISVTEGALVNYLNLVWSEIYSLVVFFELPSASSIGGASLIALCTLLLILLR